jgi:hypothetical protein
VFCCNLLQLRSARSYFLSGSLSDLVLGFGQSGDGTQGCWQCPLTPTPLLEGEGRKAYAPRPTLHDFTVQRPAGS